MNPTNSAPVLRVFPPVLEKGSHGQAVILLRLMMAPLWNQFAPKEGVSRMNIENPIFDEVMEDALSWLQFSLRMGSAGTTDKLDAPTRQRIREGLGIDLDSLTMDLFVGKPTFWKLNGVNQGEWRGTSADDPRNVTAA